MRRGSVGVPVVYCLWFPRTHWRYDAVVLDAKQTNRSVSSGRTITVTWRTLIDFLIVRGFLRRKKLLESCPRWSGPTFPITIFLFFVPHSSVGVLVFVMLNLATKAKNRVSWHARTFSTGFHFWEPESWTEPPTLGRSVFQIVDLKWKCDCFQPNMNDNGTRIEDLD